VAAGEYQPKPFVVNRAVNFFRHGGSLKFRQDFHLLLLDLEFGVATKPVGDLVAGSSQKPRPWIIRHAIFGPTLKRYH
jgi:hypothetical protein